MDYVRLGSTGLKVSRLCLGCMTYGSKAWRPWVLDADEAKPFFKLALEKGLNFFDPNEQRLLKVLQHGEFNIHGWRRSDLVALVPMTASALSR